MVILEPDRHGHPLEWLQHLVRFAARQPRSQPLYMVVAPELREPLAAVVPAGLQDTIKVLSLTPAERRYCCHSSLAVSGFARWWTMRRYLRRTQSRRGYFMSLDHLSLPLALGLGGGGARLGGILFRPSVHYRQIGAYRPNWRERVRDLRKGILYRRMLGNKSLQNVMSLDPFFPDYAAQRYRHGAKVVALPDPVYSQVLLSQAPVAMRGSAARIRFLLFGHLTERKGVLVLLEALRLLPPAIAARIDVTLAGAIDDAIRGEVLRRVGLLETQQPDLILQLDDRRLADAELLRHVEACDVVLAPYQRFVGSSGVLLWAADAHKPLLTQDYGLIGRLVRDHRLGIAVDTSNASILASALEQAAVSGDIGQYIDDEAAAKFVAERSPDRFAAEVLAG